MLKCYGRVAIIATTAENAWMPTKTRRARNMSGYCGFSKSNRAARAEREGRFPASIIAKMLGVPCAYIKERIKTNEWHHLSGWYNCVDYYSFEDIQVWIESEEGKSDLAQWKEEHSKKTTLIRTGCCVEWLEWRGTRRHPRAVVRREEGCTVEDSGGSFLRIILPNGTEIKKKRDCKGLEIKGGSI
jgi:hypothetical protein